MSDNVKIAAKLFQRWDAHACPASVHREDLGKMLSISLGLGAIFNENAEAEKAWMQAHRKEFRSRPITMMLAGHLDAVLDLVNKERGL